MKKLGLKNLEELHTITLYAFAFSLPLYQKLATILLVLLVITSLFRLNNKIVADDLWPYWIPIMLYVFIGVSLFSAEAIELKYMENRASFVALPLIFLTLKITKDIFEGVIKFFIIGCVVAVSACYANAIYNSFNWVDEALVFQPVVSGNFSFFYAVVRDGNYFFSDFFSMFHDTIYFSIYLNTAIAAILSFQLHKKNKWYILAIFLYSLTIFQLSSKIGIITCFIIFAVYLFLRLKTVTQRVLAPLFIVLIGILFLQQNPRGKAMIEKFKTEGLSIDANERFGYTLRLMSWDASLELIKNKPLTGVGVADAQRALNKKYKEKEYTTPLKQNLNSHNSFIQIFLECGIIGFILLSMMLYYLYKGLSKLKARTQRFNTLFILVILMVFLFESVLNRFSGIAFFMFFYCLLINLKKHVEIRG